MAGPQEPPPGAVDARFTLAAERTVLAWVRTALGMVAAGIAVMHVIPGFSSAGVRDVMGMALIIVGALSAGGDGATPPPPWKRVVRCPGRHRCG